LATPEATVRSRRERTRQRLITAASKLIGDHGYEALVLDAVAEGAGVTRRTIYDHFRNKDDLIVAVIYDRPTQLVVPIKQSQTLGDYLRTIADAVIEMSTDNRGLGRSTASLHLYLLTHEEFRLRAVSTNQQIYPIVEASMVAAFGEDAFAMPPRVFIRMLQAVTEGLLVRRHLMPEEFTAEVVYATFKALSPRDS
jgi:AcrR family transcriptional regulator